MDSSEEEKEYDAKQTLDSFEKDQRPSTSEYMSSSSEPFLKSSNAVLQQSSASGSEKLTLEKIQVSGAIATSEEEEESDAQQPSTSGYMLSSLSVPRSLKRSNTELQQSSASEFEKSTSEEIEVSGEEATSEEEEEYDAKQTLNLFEKDQRPSTPEYMSSSSEPNTVLQQSSASGSEKLTLEKIQVSGAIATSEEEEESGAQQPSTSGYMSSSLSVPRSLKRSNTELQQSSASELEKSTLEAIRVYGEEGNKQALGYQSPIPSAAKKFKWTNPKEQDSKADIISTKSTRQLILSNSSDEESFNIPEYGSEENLQKKNQLPSTLKYESPTLSRERSSKLLSEKTTLTAKEEFLRIVNDEIPDWELFEDFANSTKGLDMGWADIERIKENVDSDHTRKKLILQKWEQQEGDATAELLIDRVKGYKEQIEEFIRIVKDEFLDWESFEDFAFSTKGLDMDGADIERIKKNVDSDHTRKKLFLQKWVLREGNETAELLIDKVKKYKEQIEEFIRIVNDEIPDWETFEDFAFSTKGLDIDRVDIEGIKENVDSDHTRKKLILQKWGQIEKDATAELLIDRVKKHKEKIEELLQIVNSEFPYWNSFELFSLSKRGLDMDRADFERIKENVDSDHTRKKIILRKWLQQEDATAELLIDRVKKHKEHIFQYVIRDFPDWESFKKFAYCPDGLNLSLIDINRMEKTIDSVYEREKLILKKWMEQDNRTVFELLERYHSNNPKQIEEFLRIVNDEIADWESFEHFAFSTNGLHMYWAAIKRIKEKVDSDHTRKKLIMQKWVRVRGATAELLIDTAKKYKGNELTDIYCSYDKDRTKRYGFNLKFFIPFALSSIGLCMKESDVYDIINNNKTTESYKIVQMRRKWEKINGRKLSKEMFDQFVDKHENAALLTKAQDFLSDVEEFKKFALSPDGLGLRESDVHDIIEDDAIQNQEKIDRMKEKWTTKKGNSKKGVFDGGTFDYLMIKYCREYCTISSLEEWELWIPGFKERYIHQETRLILGEELRGESCIPISTWFFQFNFENLTRIQTLKNLKKHNNVVPFLQSGPGRSNCYIVTERPPTETLEDIFPDQFNENLSIDLCLQLIQGLNFLHENKIAHCNLTPQTIFVSKDRRNLKLSSYHSIFPSDDDLLLDDIYNAPEYVSNKTISGKMNIYTAGKIITKMLTNRRYPGSKTRHESIPDIDQPELDAGDFLVSNKLLLQELIQQLCNPDPDSRPTAIEALRDFTFFAYKTLYDGAQNPSAPPDLSIQSRKITTDAEETNNLEHDGTGELTQTDSSATSKEEKESDAKHTSKLFEKYQRPSTSEYMSSSSTAPRSVKRSNKELQQTSASELALEEITVSGAEEKKQPLEYQSPTSSAAKKFKWTKTAQQDSEASKDIISTESIEMNYSTTSNEQSSKDAISTESRYMDYSTTSGEQPSNIQEEGLDESLQEKDQLHSTLKFESSTLSS